MSRLSERVGAEVNRRQLLKFLAGSGIGAMTVAMLPHPALAASRAYVKAQQGGARSYRGKGGAGVKPDHCCPLYDCSLVECPSGVCGGCGLYKCTDVCTGDVHYECDCGCPYGQCGCSGYSYCG
ncbi:MAG: twin-arginine translocation signal domain-containing protein [Candidatus Dormibacteraceae bacterium]